MKKVHFPPKQRRVRCLGHIINLSLQSFLLAKNKTALQAALEAAEEENHEDEVGDFAHELAKSDAESSDGWEGIPPLQTLHKLAVWLRSSSLHMDLWRREVGLSLGIDNATRWSSWYHVIGNALKKRTQINEFLLMHHEELGGIQLSGSDWELLSKTHAVLDPFASGTLLGEQAKASAHDALVVMDGLLLFYEEFKKENSSNKRLCKAIDMGWFVLSKYYNLTDDTPVYAAGLLLDPERRLAYIEQNWHPSWLEKAVEGAKEMWEKEYKQHRDISEPPASMESSRPLNQLSKLLQRGSVKNKKKVDHAADDLEAFMKDDVLDTGCIALEWWSRVEQRSRYPTLSQMALDIFSIPAESAEAERAFSGARRIMSWDRLSMKCENAEKVECIGSWLREGHIVPSYHGGRGLYASPVIIDPEIDMEDGRLIDSIENDVF